MRCSVHNCTNDTKKTTKSHGITFHMFPKEPDLRTAWIEALGMSDWEPKERSTVCSEHFHNYDFYETKRGLRRIKNGAVPVLEPETADLEAPAALRVCRVCLSIDVKMYHMSDHKLDQMYEQATGVYLSDDDKLPQKFCWECAQRLINGTKFRSKALRTQSLLNEMINNDRYFVVSDVFLLQLPSVPPLSVETISTKDLQPMIDIEIKDETNNEIYFDEFPHQFDESDDDKKLSEISIKPKKREKKSKVKEERKRVLKKKEEVDDPESTMDKYKISDVKRRRTQDALDESLFTITPLTYEEQIAEIEKRQDLVSYKNAIFKCNVCYRGFQIKERYDAHAVRHSEQSGVYECFICKTRLKTARALRKHLTAQHTEKFSCKGCPFVTRNRGVAREHERWHAGAKYQCPHCPSEFDKLTTYMGHIRIKHVSDFVCELCGFTFVSKKGIDVHKKKKHRLADKTIPIEGPYCEMCDVKFVSDEAHSRHLSLSSKHSSDQDPNRIRNDSQSMHTTKNGRVVRKIERRPVIHPKDPTERDRRGEHQGPVTCEQCGIQLRDLRLYAQHFRRAHPDKNRTKYPAMKTPCMCEQCGRIFQSMALLKDHMWVHTGEKRFKCDRCPKSFTQKTNLVFHLRAHSAQRPTYECPLCGKHFAFYNNRRRHMFIHTGLKPFKCDTCGKCFTTSGEQRAHVEHVHLKKPWPKRARAHRHHHGADDDWHKCNMDMVED
ncbi:hypothetical protein K1T71_000777 [Dendrolimus kikuchii]|uniref:Uncharacterized protein n=1 Tax=Dendrolimus kikuchii TaxID=765133 RepID=A0ACC1DK45_9NEOP|nr:hypothetical protein K1T71_000777 [Dendrolimus kikuchii]